MLHSTTAVSAEHISFLYMFVYLFLVLFVYLHLCSLAKCSVLYHGTEEYMYHPPTTAPSPSAVVKNCHRHSPSYCILCSLCPLPGFVLCISYLMCFGLGWIGMSCKGCSVGDINMRCSQREGHCSAWSHLNFWLKLSAAGTPGVSDCYWWIQINTDTREMRASLAECYMNYKHENIFFKFE